VKDEAAILRAKLSRISDILENVEDEHTWHDEHGEWVSTEKIRMIVICSCPAAGDKAHWYGCTSLGKRERQPTRV